MERRALLLNSVLLRQNPHNVQQWHKRVQLYEGKPEEVNNIVINMSCFSFTVHKLIETF